MNSKNKHNIFHPRRKTVQVKVGNLWIGSDYPVSIQSMTTADPMDTANSVREAIRIIESGSELVRFSIPDIRAAENLKEIKNKIRAQGYHTPLIADIHYTPRAAERAAQIVEKVRINPGNYADKKRFQKIEYDDDSYQLELERIRDRVLPLIRVCKEYGTVLRIGTNHGSLSDRIMNRYGDTALGMVESALEFVRICEDENFSDIILSMKASNPIVMIEANLLMVDKLAKEKLKPYPIHLGVTEAGDGEEGRVKSALGIGTLLDKGIGDTIRISLTEPPEKEAPVAHKLLERYEINEPRESAYPNSPKSLEINGQNTTISTKTPIVIVDFSKISLKEEKQLEAICFKHKNGLWLKDDLAPDYIYTGQQIPTLKLPKQLKQIIDYSIWKNNTFLNNTYPLYTYEEYFSDSQKHPEMNFLKVDFHLLNDIKIERLVNTFIIVQLDERPTYLESVSFIKNSSLLRSGTPLIFNKTYHSSDFETVQLNAAIDLGGLFIEEMGSGIMLSGNHPVGLFNQLAFSILQAARVRISKTEFISCPSCGRTQFDLQKVTQEVKKETHHLKGLKIAIMGCIVNGPGEMVDADYGYVGSGKDKISLYRGKEIVLKNVNAKDAVKELINIIKEDGKWKEPKHL